MKPKQFSLLQYIVTFGALTTTIHVLWIMCFQEKIIFLIIFFLMLLLIHNDITEKIV